MRQIHEDLENNVIFQPEKQVINALCLYTLYTNMFQDEAKDIWKKAWSIQTKLPLLQVHYYVCVYICEFMTQICPLKKIPRSIDPKVAVC